MDACPWATPASTRCASPRTTRRALGCRCASGSGSRRRTPRSPSWRPRALGRSPTTCPRRPRTSCGRSSRRSGPATFSVGKGGQAVVVMGPEHALAVRQAGWTQRGGVRVPRARSRILPRSWRSGVHLEVGSAHDMTPGSDGRLPSLASPDDVFLVTAGGPGAGWSAYLPAFAPRQHTRAITRRVRLPGSRCPTAAPTPARSIFRPSRGAMATIPVLTPVDDGCRARARACRPRRAARCRSACGSRSSSNGKPRRASSSARRGGVGARSPLGCRRAA